MVSDKLVPRLIRPDIERMLAQSQKAILIRGPRQVGKTTLVREILQSREKVLYVNGDGTTDRLQWNNINFSELQDLTAGYDYVFIDEAQRIENIGLTIKQIVDQLPQIQVIATGSSSLDLASTISEPLTGRKWSYELLPLNWSEIERAYTYPVARKKLDQILVRGAYPEVITEEAFGEKVLEEIVDSYLYRDVLQYGNIKKPDILVRLLRLVAYQVGSEVSYQELGRNLELDTKTVRRYIGLLEESFVLYRLEVLSRNPRKEIVTGRKLYFLDNGVRNALINDLKPLSQRGDIGALWENYVISEVYKHLQLPGNRGDMFYWRGKQTKEVDLVLSREGAYEAFEIKYNVNKRVVFPKSFLEFYQPSRAEVVNPGNFHALLRGEVVEG